MHLILSLVCKRWSETVNRNFRDTVHIASLDREFSANNWNAEIKRKYRVPLTVLKCLKCNRNFKPEIGYWRDPRSCTAIYGADKHISGYCSECEASCSTSRFYMLIDFQTMKYFFMIYITIVSVKVVLTCDIG